jgi:hypothetical protein
MTGWIDPIETVLTIVFVGYMVLGMVFGPIGVKVFYNWLRLRKYGFYETKKYRYTRVKKE